MEYNVSGGGLSSLKKSFEVPFWRLLGDFLAGPTDGMSQGGGGGFGPSDNASYAEDSDISK